jgi:hypothetical protein
LENKASDAVDHHHGRSPSAPLEHPGEWKDAEGRWLGHLTRHACTID